MEKWHGVGLSDFELYLQEMGFKHIGYWERDRDFTFRYITPSGCVADVKVQMPPSGEKKEGHGPWGEVMDVEIHCGR
jgi:hypothetical protein